MSLSLTRVDANPPPGRSRWLRRHPGLVTGFVFGSLVALGGWRLAVAIKNVRVAASRMADT